MKSAVVINKGSMRLSKKDKRIIHQCVVGIIDCRERIRLLEEAKHAISKCAPSTWFEIEIRLKDWRSLLQSRYDEYKKLVGGEF